MSKTWIKFWKFSQKETSVSDVDDEAIDFPAPRVCCVCNSSEEAPFVPVTSFSVPLPLASCFPKSKNLLRLPPEGPRSFGFDQHPKDSAAGTPTYRRTRATDPPANRILTDSNKHTHWAKVLFLNLLLHLELLTLLTTSLASFTQLVCCFEIWPQQK